jgi:N-acetylneuraminic acid mutarotase
VGFPALTSAGASGTDSRETVAEAGTDDGRERENQCETGGSYATGTPIPEIELGNNAGAMVDGRLYTIGGFLDDVGDERLLQATDEVFAYDVREDVWDRTVENLPRKLWGMDAIGVDGEVYAWGGAEPEAPFGEGRDDPVYMSESIYRLVPGEGWAELEATVPGGVLMESRSLYDPADGLVYVFGGAVSAEENTDRIWTFDPETEAIEDERWATLPEPTRWPSVGLVEVDGRRYAHCMGGIAYDEDGHYTIDTNVRYELATGQRERMTELDEGLVHATGQNPVLDNVVYLLKGTRALAYDPVDDAFSEVESIGEEVSFGAHSVSDGELILLGGHDKVETGVHEGAHDTEDRVWRYRPPC